MFCVESYSGTWFSVLTVKKVVRFTFLLTNMNRLRYFFRGLRLYYMSHNNPCNKVRLYSLSLTSSTVAKSGKYIMHCPSFTQDSPSESCFNDFIVVLAIRVLPQVGNTKYISLAVALGFLFYCCYKTTDTSVKQSVTVAQTKISRKISTHKSSQSQKIFM